MKTTELLGNIMTSIVMTVDPKDTLERVHSIFQREDFHHLPVLEPDGRLVGMMSKADYYQLQDSFTIFRKAEDAETQNRRLFRSLLVEEVMAVKLAVLCPTDTVATALGYFQKNRFRAIPIVSDDQHLLGIVTPLDLLNYAFKEETLLNT